jgi:spore germination protein YaaH
MIVCIFVLAFTSLAPAFASAATKFEVSGWLPYWRGATSTADVLPHLNLLTEVNPFVYALKSDGTILDQGPMSTSTWQMLVGAAQAQNVRVIPTIMTGSGDLLHALLSNSKKRITLEKTIVALVKQNNYDGIDIDFEGKHAADKTYFSTFLKGLYQRMGNKFVMCSIEARTPTDARYYGTTVPPDAEIYANDLTAINKYCDRVRVMTYDQQGIDLQLAAVAASSSTLYAPVADPAWVEKVINLMSTSIKKSKIEIGIPTYGYEYAVTAYAGNQYVYDILWTFNPLYALQVAQKYGVTPARAPWGEMTISHIKDAGATTTVPIADSLFVANAAAVAASQYASSTNSHVDFRYLVWPDAQSIADKIALAKRLGVRGVAIFKFDGGEDPGIWQVLQGVKQ